MGIEVVANNRIQLRSATGTFNLLPQLSELVVYENLFRPALTATLILKEAHNLPQKLPIVGEETLDIDFGTRDFENNTIRIKPSPFHINSIQDREIIKPKAQLLVLTLVSEKFMSNSHAKISRSYRDKTIGEIVTDIHGTYLDDGSDLFVEPTDRIERCIIPNMEPFDAIKWLSFRAIPDGSDRSTPNVNYLYYETVGGSFFVSINSLIKHPPVFVCGLKPRIKDATGELALNAGIIIADKIKFLHTFNRYENIKRGVYASKLITHDIVKKKITQHDNNYLYDWLGSNHLGKHPPVSMSDVETKSASVNRTSFAPPPKNISSVVSGKQLAGMVDSRVEFYPKHDRMYSTWTGDSYDNKAEDWKLQRNSIGLFQGVNMYVECIGVSSLRVGQLIHLLVPSTETTGSDKMSDVAYDKSLSGNFIVTAIKHIFSVESSGGTGIEYRMGIELCKDGSEEPVPVRKSRKEES